MKIQNAYSQVPEPQILILVLLSSFAAISAVLFTPALPEIAQQLGVSNAIAQLTMTVFLVGYALGNLPYGPISNRFGRKPTIYLGISLAIVGSLLILSVEFLQYFWLFLLGRFLMALGSSVGLKIAFTMIGDVYEQKIATKKITFVMMSFAIGPGLAIALGGFLTHRYGWMSCFYFLTAYCFLLLFLSSFLPETSQKRDLQALNFDQIQSGYLRQLRNKKLLSCSFIMGAGTSIIYLFASEAPFIGMNSIGLSPDQYGLLNFIPPIGMLGGSIISHAIAGKFEPPRVMRLGIFIALSMAVLMLIFFSLGIISISTLFLPMPLLFIGLSLIYSNVSSLAMTHSKDKSNASAMMNFINLGSTVVILAIVGMLPINAPYIMPLFFTLLGCMMLFLRKRLVFELKRYN